MKPSIGSENRLAVLKLVGAYIFFGILWIYLSDTILGWIVHDQDFMTHIAMFKGTLFVVLTAILLYYLITRHVLKFKITEAQLKESEERYRSILENIEEAYYEVDLEGRFTFFNPSIPRTYGYTDDELLGASYKVAMDKENIDDVFNAFHQVYVTGETIKGVDWKLRHKNGKEIHVEASVSLRRDGQGNPIGFKGITRDITERKQAEEALRMVAKEWQATFDAVGSAVWLLDENQRIVRANKATKSILGKEPSEVIGRFCWEVVHGFSKPHIECPVIHMQKTLHRESMELTKGDSWLEVVVDPIMDDADYIQGIVHIVSDITERKQYEAALQESEERFRLAFNTSPDAININCLENGLYVDINDGFTVLTGFTREDVIGKTSVEINIWQNANDRKKLIQGLQAKGYYENLEAQFRKKDGSCATALMSARVIMHKGTQHIISITRDITELKHAEEEKKILEAQLTQAQKMESIGTLAGGIAHDFNNILSAIFGYTQLAMDDVSDPEKTRKELREVLKAGDRAKKLVSQILTFSRKADARYSPITLTKIVKDSIKMLRSVLPTTIEIRLDLIDYGLVMADPTQIHQVMMNLCTNAAHAMDKTGGVMEVRLKKVDIDEGAQTIEPNLSPGPYLWLSVSDTGHGMTPDVMARIFDPYFTTKEVGRGTGLGLAVVHGIVKSHGGTITCKSSPGKGTAFDIYLPEILSDEAVVSHYDGWPLPIGTERILFVDDEPMLVELAVKMLSKLGYKVVTKSNSSEALELFQKEPDKYDLVITDMTMPGMTGDILAQKFMEIRHDIPIMLCSGYSEHISEEKAKKIGIREFVMKPLEMKELAKTIRKVLDGR